MTTIPRRLVWGALLCIAAGFAIALLTPALPPFSRALRCAIDALVGVMLALHLRQPDTTSLPADRGPRAKAVALRVLAIAAAALCGAVVVAAATDPWLRWYRVCLTVGFVAMFGAGLTVKQLLSRMPLLGRAAMALSVVDSAAMIMLYLTADYPGLSRLADTSLLPTIAARDPSPDRRNLYLLSDGRYLEMIPGAANLLIDPRVRAECSTLSFLSESGPVRSFEGDDVQTYTAAGLASCARQHGSAAQAARAYALFIATARAHPTLTTFADESHARACGLSVFDGTLFDIATSNMARGAFGDELWHVVRARARSVPAQRDDRRGLTRWTIACGRAWLAQERRRGAYHRNP